MTPMVTAIVAAVAAVVVLAILLYGIPWLIRKHFPVSTYLNIGEEGLNMLKSIIEPLLPPADQKILDTLVNYAELAVKYAEQLYASGQLPADQRKQAAIQFVENAAKSAGITLTATEMTFVNAVIEAAVYLLPETNKVIKVVPTPTPVASGTSNVVPAGTDTNTNATDVHGNKKNF